MKKIVLGTLISFGLLGSSLYGSECESKGEKFISVAGECLETSVFKGDEEGKLNIVLHGTWKSGTNTLGRYAPFAESLVMDSDITTVAVALPGYSKSTSTKLKCLSDGEGLSTKEDYVNFALELISKLKNKYEADTVNYLGHSASASMGAKVAEHNSGLNVISLAGGKYENVDISKLDKNLKYILVYGTQDKISEPKHTLDFYDKLEKEGFNVTLVKAEQAHLDLDMSDPSVSAFISAIGE